MERKEILVVDDERDIVEIVCELLEDAGFATVPAYDGQEALEAIAKRRPDGVVLDIKMPVLDGIGVIKHLRRDPALAAMPVVVLTATRVIQDLKEQFKKLQVAAWLSKPFEPEELVAVVKQVLGIR